MTEDEKKNFTDYVIEQVQGILNDQTSANDLRWLNFNKDFGERLEETLPAVLKDAMPKNNFWFPIINSIINGIAVGAAVYISILLSS